MRRKIIIGLVYAAVTGTIILSGCIAFLLVSAFARDGLKLYTVLNRASYSTIQALIVIAIYVLSPLAAIPVTRYFVSYLPRRNHDTRSTSSPSRA